MSSPQIESLAEQFGASAALIERSAAARAAALGSSPEAVLAGWTGGEAPPAAPPAAVPPPEAPEPPPTEEVPEAGPSEAEVEPEPRPAEPVDADDGTQPEPIPSFPAPAVAVPDPVPAGSLSLLLVASIVLVAAMFVATVVAPITSNETPSLDAIEPIALSASGESGREIYLAEGCAECHTQQVRPIVTDADLGTVTLAGSPLIPGYRRIGPDLSHSGSRQPTDDPVWLVDYLENPEASLPGSDHPSFSYLPTGDLNDLATYLVESK